MNRVCGKVGSPRRRLDSRGCNGRAWMQRWKYSRAPSSSPSSSSSSSRVCTRVKRNSRIHSRGRACTGVARNKASPSPSPEWIRVNLKGNAADAAIFSIQRDRRGRLRIQAASVEEIGTERFRDPFQHLSQIFPFWKKQRENFEASKLLFFFFQNKNNFFMSFEIYRLRLKNYRITIKIKRANPATRALHALFARMSTMMIHGDTFRIP